MSIVEGLTLTAIVCEIIVWSLVGIYKGICTIKKKYGNE